SYVRALASHLSAHGPYQHLLDAATVDLLYRCAPLHDIGKVAVRDVVLLKPGKLTPEEFDEMKQHVVYGSKALAVAEGSLGNSSFLAVAREIILGHHEKWDGSGYPYGLKGSEIPFPGRLMAIADVYDALISRRVYKPAFSHGRAMEIIVEGRGAHFDPAIVDAFLCVADEFQRIAHAYADEGLQAG
ncbi:MAG: two-component system response regulator, partial [Betaproteobacteria bacterium HGW-Betaproteobacteria-19]